jgi:hypothetical protein
MEPLSAEEVRVLGCLIEKERTTPEYYPMTINALVAACNQKTNRNPVVEYDELTVEQTIRSLDNKGIIGLTRASGGRNLKYLHKAEDAYEVDSEQLAILAVLLLRGPQTPGELRSRTERYFSGEQPLDKVEVLLNDLMSRSGPLVERLPREPGQKENRFRTLITTPSGEEPQPAPAAPPDQLTDRVATLERQFRALAASLGVDLDEPITDNPDQTFD